MHRTARAASRAVQVALACAAVIACGAGDPSGASRPPAREPLAGTTVHLLDAVDSIGWEIPARSLPAEIRQELQAADFRIEGELLDRGCTHFAGYRGSPFDSWLCRTRFPLDVQHETDLNLIVMGGKAGARSREIGVYDEVAAEALPRRDPDRPDAIDTWIPVREGFVLFRRPAGLDAPPEVTYRVRYPVARDYLASLEFAESGLDPMGFALREIEIDGDVRPALFAPAPAAYTFTLVVPPDGRLNVGIGVLEEGWFESDGVTFTISAGLPDGEALVLHSQRLSPRDGATSRRWHDLDVDLAALSGKTVELILSTSDPEPGFDLGAFAAPILYSAKIERTPVVLVDIDTLRADHLEAYGYDRPTSPVIRAFAEESVVFETAIAQAPWTLPSQMSILTGRYPVSHGVRGPGHQLDRSIPTLATLLRGSGYFTKAITDGAFMSHRFGFHHGFDSYSEHRGQRAHSYSLVADLMRRFRQWFDLWVPRNNFLLIHSFETHAPYAPPDPAVRLFDAGYRGTVGERFNRAFVHRATDGFQASSREREHLTARYDGEIRYVDETLGRIFQMLRTRGVYDEALVILVSDHGEEFFDHGGWQHGQTFFDEMIRVPLIMKFPRGTIAPRRVTRQVEMIDVVPTILDYLNLEGGDRLDGESLLPLLSADPDSGSAVAISEQSDGPGIAIRTRTHKWIRSAEGVRVYSLLDDPTESQPLADVDPRLLHEFEAIADAYLERERAQAPGTGELKPISPGLEMRLRALGYLD
ncbi:MAG: sulfatase [bacterium]|nr:sulfatase [bacterium]